MSKINNNSWIKPRAKGYKNLKKKEYFNKDEWYNNIIYYNNIKNSHFLKLNFQI
jgi:hypothetical protein